MDLNKTIKNNHLYLSRTEIERLQNWPKAGTLYQAPQIKVIPRHRMVSGGCLPSFEKGGVKVDHQASSANSLEIPGSRIAST